MSLTFNKFFENYTNHHSFTDLLNLCKEVSDYVYNNDITHSQLFDSFNETKNGYEVLFNKNDKKNYIINLNKKTIKDQKGDKQLIDSAYEDIENLYDMIKNDFIVNIKQMDENLKNIKINEGFEDELKGKLENEYISLKRGILDLLDKHLKGDMSKLQNFIDSYIEPDSEELIEGFIEDADIMDFYLKYQSDVDQVLLDNNYYDDPPGVESLYDYVIDGTYDAVIYCMENMKKELYD